MSSQSARRSTDITPAPEDVDSLLVVSEHVSDVSRVVIRAPEPAAPKRRGGRAKKRGAARKRRKRKS